MSGKKVNTMSRKTDTYRMQVPADSANLGVIRMFISEIAGNMGFSEDEVYQIELAVDEASANIVNYAYKNYEAKEQTIQVTVRVKADKLMIHIVDKGKGFDPQSLQSPDMDQYLKERRQGGLGVHLIKTLMDEVDFRIKPGVRNEVKMVKYFHA